MSEQTNVYIWRNRRRGFLVVTAKSLEDAHAIIQEKHTSWLNYAQHHMPEQMPARAGSLLYVQQRV
jgi:hypothetical protein